MNIIGDDIPFSTVELSNDGERTVTGQNLVHSIVFNEYDVNNEFGHNFLGAPSEVPFSGRNDLEAAFPGGGPAQSLDQPQYYNPPEPPSALFREF